ncbi:MAG: PHB depolymerase family esterase [Gemmatimonadaceae bacterium]
MRLLLAAALAASFTSAQAQRVVVYRPASEPANEGKRALVVMLHGCAENADDFARGTRMNAAADSLGFVVMYPEQPAAAHPQRCWNWFAPEQFTRGKGEVAWLAGVIDSVARIEGIDSSRISLVGMSAGAAMAANLMVAYRERFAALVMHSGIAALAATDVPSALAAMRDGAGDGKALGLAALAAMGARARPVPVMLLHGKDDKLVALSNMTSAAEQWMLVNRGGAMVSALTLTGVGHAWSGGAADAPFTAPNGPDATKLIVQFLKQYGAIP